MFSQLSVLTVELQVTVLNGIPLVQLPTCLSMAEVMALKATCQQLWQKRPAQIILDLSQTTSIESSAINALVSDLQTVTDLGVELVVWSVQPQIMGALLAAGLERLVMIDSETKALNLADTYQLKDRQPTNYLSVRSWIKQIICKLSQKASGQPTPSMGGRDRRPNAVIRH